MVFSRFFKKDYRHYLTQGEKYLQGERYADARTSFIEASERVGKDAVEDARLIDERLAFAGNKLAELNLHEGERSITGGDLAKAEEHFQLAVTFASDPALRNQAEKALKGLDLPQGAPAGPAASPAKKEAHQHVGGGCGGCGGGHDDPPPMTEEPDHNLSDHDRVHLLYGPLPGDLPERYAALGEDFAKAFLLIHEGDDAQAFPILEKMYLSSTSDIVNYELALILYRARQPKESAQVLEQALRINPMNPLCHLTRVHMDIDAGRFQSAVANLKKMRELDIMADTALFMLGDLHAGAGDKTAAMEYFTQALEIPSLARSAAERIMPMLTETGRTQEAQFLAKKYLKGCC